MAIRKLARKEWEAFFNRVSSHLTAQIVEIEVLSPTLGAQVEAKSAPLVGLGFDPKRDVLDVAMRGRDHRIRSPKEVYVDETPQGLQSLEVVSADGVKEILAFRSTLQLAPAAP